MKNIKNYLQKQDELLGEYLNLRPAIEVTANHNISLFQALTKSIVSQQLSGKAATTIFQRLVTNMGQSGTISPGKIAVCSLNRYELVVFQKIRREPSFPRLEK